MATQTDGIRVLLVDDHRMVREAIRSLLKSVPTIDVVGEADNGAEAIACIGKLNGGPDTRQKANENQSGKD